MDISSFAEAFADSFYKNVFYGENQQLKQGKRTPPHFQSNAFDALASEDNVNRTADQAPNRAKAFSLQPPVTLLPEHRSDGICSPLDNSPPSIGANCVRSLLLEPDMEDLTDIIPI